MSFGEWSFRSFQPLIQDLTFYALIASIKDLPE